MKKNNRALQFLLSPLVQLCSIIVIFLLLFLFAEIKIAYPQFIDFQPKVQQSQQLDKGLPATQVSVGLNIQNFLTFDIINNNFVADVNVWFEYNPAQVTVEELRQFDFNKGTILDKREPVVKQLSADTMLARFDMRVQFTSNLNYKYFPIDSHKVFLTLNNKTLDARKVEFVHANSFVFDKNIYIPGYKIYGTQQHYGYSTIVLDAHNEQKIFNYPRAVFEIDAQQQSSRNFIFIVLPMIIILLITMCAFVLSLKIHFSTVLGIASAGVGALMGYRYVIEKVSPRVSYYMLSDHIFVLFLVILFIIFFIDIFYREKIDKSRPLILLILYIFFILGLSFLMFIW